MGSQLSEFDESGAKAGHAGRELLIAILLVALPVIVVAALMINRGRESESTVESAAYSMDPADRKFLNEPYRGSAVVGGVDLTTVDAADRKFYIQADQSGAGAIVRRDETLTAAELSALRWQAMAEFYEKNGLLTRRASGSEATVNPSSHWAEVYNEDSLLTGAAAVPGSYWAGVNGAMPGISAFAIEAEMAADSEVEPAPFSTEIYWEMARRHELESESEQMTPRRDLRGR
jgi:hypothetical protein